MALVANKLVKNTIVMGLEIVSRNTEVKLVRRLVEFVSMFQKPHIIIVLIIIIPNIIRTIELIIQNIFLNFLFSSNFPTPTIASVI